MKSITITQGEKSQQLNFSDSITGMNEANTFMVVGPRYYGYGESIKSAKQNCIKAGCKKMAVVKAYLGDESLGVTNFGEIRADKVLFCLGEV